MSYKAFWKIKEVIITPSSSCLWPIISQNIVTSYKTCLQDEPSVSPPSLLQEGISSAITQGCCFLPTRSPVLCDKMAHMATDVWDLVSVLSLIINFGSMLSVSITCVCFSCCLSPTVNKFGVCFPPSCLHARLISQPLHIQSFKGYLGPPGVSCSRSFLCVFHPFVHGGTQLSKHLSFLSTQLYLREEGTSHG